MGQQQSIEIPKPKINVSGKIPWDRTSTMIGGGFDGKKYQPRPTPFIEPPEIEPPTPALEVIFNSHIIHTEEQLEEGIKLSCNISAPLHFASTEASLDYVSGIKCNTTNMTTIISCTIEPPSQKGLENPQLTSEANALLNKNPKKFTQRYGHYFVSGQQARSTLVAICSHSTRTKEELDTFKTKLGVGYKMAKLEAASEYIKLAKDSNVDIKIDTFVLGSNPKKGLEHFTSSEIDFIILLKRFQKGYAPIPYLALLTPYSWIDSRAPADEKGFTLPQDLKDALQKTLVLEARAQSCMMTGAQKMRHEISELRKRITNIQLSHNDWRNQLVEWKEEFEKSREQVDRWFKRQALLARATELSVNKIPKDTWFKTKHALIWEIGCTQLLLRELQNNIEESPKACTRDTNVKRNYSTRILTATRKHFKTKPTPGKPEIRHDILEFPKDSRDQKTLRHNYEDRIIIGVKIESQGEDKRSRWKLVQGGVGQENNGVLGVEFKIENTKFVAWAPDTDKIFELRKERIVNCFKVEVWSVDRELYAH